jgi:threonine dehydratase
MNAPTYADVIAAVGVVHTYLKPTPLYEWPALSRLLGCRYFLKYENHTPTTAFKVRGILSGGNLDLRELAQIVATSAR